MESPCLNKKLPILPIFKKIIMRMFCSFSPLIKKLLISNSKVPDYEVFLHLDSLGVVNQFNKLLLLISAAFKLHAYLAEF